MFEQREARLIYGVAGSFERGHTAYEMGMKCFSHLLSRQIPAYLLYFTVKNGRYLVGALREIHLGLFAFTVKKERVFSLSASCLAAVWRS